MADTNIVVKDYNIPMIIEQLNCWCLNYSGNINSIYTNELTMVEQIEKLFFCVKTTMQAQVSLTENFKELYQFVIDYFDSLDVQEKLNELITKRFDELMINAIYQPSTETIILRKGVLNNA